MISDLIYLYIISLLPFRDWHTVAQLHQRFGSFEKVWQTNITNWYNFGLNPKIIEQWKIIKHDNDPEKIWQLCLKNNIALLNYSDALYPKLLKQIYDPPLLLFYKGVLISADEACVAIVGSRLMTSYGKVAVPRIAEPLIASGCTIVSGLAYGIDAAAHNEAIKNNRRTIAVLGSGLDDNCLYPKMNLNLSKQILENNGLLLSQYPPGMPAFQHQFVARNRIVAGMSLGVCVVECKTKSGALITADYAMDMGRPVYAVPGPINSALSEGPNNLIKNGATPITSGKDILEDLNLSITVEPTKKTALNSNEARVLKCMQSEPLTIDDICELTKLSSNEVISTLTMLELQSLIMSSNDGYIKR